MLHTQEGEHWNLKNIRDGASVEAIKQLWWTYTDAGTKAGELLNALDTTMLLNLWEKCLRVYTQGVATMQEAVRSSGVAHAEGLTEVLTSYQAWVSSVGRRRATAAGEAGPQGAYFPGAGAPQPPPPPPPPPPQPEAAVDMEVDEGAAGAALERVPLPGSR